MTNYEGHLKFGILLQENKMKGTIDFVAKTGGFKLQESKDVWRNPVKEWTSYVLDNLKKGDVVVLGFDAEGKVNSINKVTDEAQKTEVPEIRVNPRPSLFDEKTKDIHKQVAIKTAFNYVRIDAHTPPEVRDAWENYCWNLADRIEKKLNE